MGSPRSTDRCRSLSPPLAALGLAALGLAALGLAACTGSIDGSNPAGSSSATSGGEPSGSGGAGGGPETGVTGFACDPAAIPPQLPLRRLSRLQRENTIRDLARWAFPGAESDDVVAALEPLFARIPADEKLGADKHYARLSRLDQALQQEHVDAAYDIGRALGAALLASGGRVEAVVGACATNGDAADDDVCLDDFILRFGERALRRAPSSEDVAFYRQVAGAVPFDTEDYVDVIALLVTSPHALYFVEHGEGEGDLVPLSAYEAASRLSFHFWQTLPDEELFAVARDGSLLDAEVYAAQVDRVFADPRTRAAVGSFFGEWLENSTLDELDSRVGTPVFDALRGTFEPGPDLREAMLAEVVDASIHYAYDTPGTFADLLQSRRSFARTEELAQIYGVAPWQEGDEPPEIDDPARVGLITRAAYVATGSPNTRPIMKGVFLRKALLCDDLDPPPANAAANPPELSEDLTTRQVVEELTGQAACAGCHQTFINGLGFATENFDALGRTRTEQVFYDAESGEVVGSAPVDTATMPQVEVGDATESAGAADLLGLLVASEKPHACFARQYFRFTFARTEDPAVDGCALAQVDDALDDERPLAEVLRAIALARPFRERSFVDTSAAGEP